MCADRACGSIGAIYPIAAIETRITGEPGYIATEAGPAISATCAPNSPVRKNVTDPTATTAEASCIVFFSPTAATATAATTAQIRATDAVGAVVSWATANQGVDSSIAAAAGIGAAAAAAISSISGQALVVFCSVLPG